MTPVPSLCWRCSKVAVKCYGVTCLPCRAILHAEYDAARAANGGKLLYLPDDWDGPALLTVSVPEPRMVDCMDCGQPVERKPKAPVRKGIRCVDCRRTHSRRWMRDYQRRALDVSTI